MHNPDFLPEIYPGSFETDPSRANWPMHGCHGFVSPFQTPDRAVALSTACLSDQAEVILLLHGVRMSTSFCIHASSAVGRMACSPSSASDATARLVRGPAIGVIAEASRPDLACEA